MAEIKLIGQKLVSGDKYRYQDGTYDLDLTYIYPNLIAMAIPGQGVETAWRNDINDVSRFLNSKHGHDYRIFNLTGEKYDYDKFNRQIVDFDFPDHHPPPLKLLHEAVLGIHSWLNADKQHVAVVHCLAGRSRTGCVISAYLVYSGLHPTAEAAINYFNVARSEEGLNVVLPSQIRYVKYYEQLLRNNNFSDLATPPAFTISSIRLNPSPLVEGGKKEGITLVKSHTGGAFSPIVRVGYLPSSVKDDRPYITEVTRSQIWAEDGSPAIEVNATVSGDIMITIFHNSKSATAFAKSMKRLGYSSASAVQMAFKFPRVPLLRYTFHTHFVNEGILVIPASELDAPLAGPVITNKYLVPEMKLEIILKPGSSPLPSNSLSALSSANMAIGVALNQATLSVMLNDSEITISAPPQEINALSKKDTAHNVNSTSLPLPQTSASVPYQTKLVRSPSGGSSSLAPPLASPSSRPRASSSNANDTMAPGHALLAAVTGNSGQPVAHRNTSQFPSSPHRYSPCPSPVRPPSPRQQPSSPLSTGQISRPDAAFAPSVADLRAQSRNPATAIVTPSSSNNSSANSSSIHLDAVHASPANISPTPVTYGNAGPPMGSVVYPTPYIEASRYPSKKGVHPSAPSPAAVPRPFTAPLTFAGTPQAVYPHGYNSPYPPSPYPSQPMTPPPYYSPYPPPYPQMPYSGQPYPPNPYY